LVDVSATAKQMNSEQNSYDFGHMS
jgi:hypothetical protein